MTGRTGTMDRQPGRGELAERARHRRFWTTMGALMLVGGVVGAILSIATKGDLSADLPTAWAVVAALVYGVGVTAGSWHLFRTVDEVEIRDNLVAGAIGVYFYSLVYPVWYFLWKGGLLGEPIQEVVFLGTMAVMMLAYLWKKVRP